jgi:hypothetical protein
MFMLLYNADYLDFTRDVTGDSRTFTVAVSVLDGKGGSDSTSWEVTVNDLEPEVTLTGDTGFSECDTFDFDADITSPVDDIISIEWGRWF